MASQNDGAPPCGCPDCLAQDAKYGGPSGTIVNFVNLCAEEIGRCGAQRPLKMPVCAS